MFTSNWGPLACTFVNYTLNILCLVVSFNNISFEISNHMNHQYLWGEKFILIIHEIIFSPLHTNNFDHYIKSSLFNFLDLWTFPFVINFITCLDIFFQHFKITHHRKNTLQACLNCFFKFCGIKTLANFSKKYYI
jgi:hypothetical protein